MGKVHGGLVVFAIVAAGLLGLAASRIYLQSAPAVTAALAQQELARADKLAAEADSARASAAGAWALAGAVQALAAAVATWAPAIIAVALLAIAMLFIRLAWAAGSFATSRARLRVVAGPAGPIVAYQHNGRLLLLDTARSLGGVASLDELSGRLELPAPADEELALSMASQALAAGVITRVAGQDAAAGADVVERVGAGLHAVLGSLTLPSFRGGNAPARPSMATDMNRAGMAATINATAAAAPALRYMKVRTPEDRNREAAELDANDLRGFIVEGQAHGFGRAYWVGRALATGRRCTRTRWQWLSGALEGAGIMGDGPNNTRVLTVDQAQAFDRLSLDA